MEKTMTTEEGNKLIYDFMRPKPSMQDVTMPMRIDRLNYHEDWNALMPVVEKIEKYRMTYPQANWVCDCKIIVYQKVLWREVVNFIQWHNQLTQNKEI